MAKFPLSFPYKFADPALNPVDLMPNYLFEDILYNLVPGQYQAGSLVFGRGTTVRVETFDVKPYDQNNQDYPVTRADEIAFGQDSLKPSTLELTFDVINNKLRPGYEDLIPNFWAEMPKVEYFSNLWRNDKNRRITGSMMPLYICGKDGLTRTVVGRPGQFTYTKVEEFDEFTQCLAEFRRVDTLAHTTYEAVQELALSADPVYLLRETGDGPDAWLRLLLVGPLTHPIVTVGDQQVELDYEIEDGNAVEISSYPWQRRAVDANGVNLANYLIGTTNYLDKLKLPFMSPVELKWTSSEANTMVPALGDISFAQNIDGYSMLQAPPGYTQIHGNTIVRFDLFNFGSSVFPWLTPSKYLGPGPFQTKVASYYNLKKYNTPNQFASALIVNSGLEIGQTVLGIMTNSDMSSLVGVMVDVQLSGSYIRIVSGSWSSMTTRAFWRSPSLFGFTESDRVSIEYDPETTTYTAKLNGNTKCFWNDSGHIANTDETCRYQSFVFDAGGGLGILQGVGFRNIIGYDTLQEEAQLGQVFLLWRDSWSTVG